MKRLFFTILLIFNFGIAQDFSIQEAWNYVLDHNDGIKAQELGVKREQKMHLASKLSFLPNIDITALYAHVSDPVGINLSGVKNDVKSAIPSSILPQALPIINQIPNQINFVKQDIIVGSLNIIYPLYTGGKRLYATKIAALQQKDANEMLRLKKLATFEELVKIYYGVLLQQEVLETLREIEDGAKVHFTNAKKLQKAGQVATLEVLSAQVAYDKAKNKSKDAQNHLEVLKLALNTVLGTQDASPISKIIIPQAALMQSNEMFVQRTLQSYPALKSLDDKILIANEIKKIEISHFLPEVAFVGSYFLHNDFLLNDKLLPTWYVGIGAKMPLITPGGRIPKIQAAKIAQMQLDKTKSQAIKDMELLVKRTYKEVIFSQQEFWSLNSSISLARENLKLQEKAFSQGLATSVQVSDARNMLASALIEQKTVAYKYIVSLSKLMAVSDNIAMFYQIQQ